jgi:flavin-dependent dehydrogenase
LSLIKSVLIVGGGTAGWLSAAILASKHRCSMPAGLGGINISLVESPDIATIGVGEGTWPSMKSTLRSIGVDEIEFLKACSASFKQGSKFVAWRTGGDDDVYYHPFDLPEMFYEGNLAAAWLNEVCDEPFAKWVSLQEGLCEANLSPKLLTSGQYSGVANYGYHLDAGKFADFLKQHCTQKLGVNFISDSVVGVVSSESGDIAAVKTLNSGLLEADLFLDCTGFSSLLLGKHYGIQFIDKSSILPINSAVAVHMPYSEGEAVASATISTAQEAGWIWDIGLANRRGVGHVYCDAYISKEQAIQQLCQYLGLTEQQFSQLKLKSIAINPGYREKIWHQNCVAIGLSAGFLEPLEASAMMLIEVSANMIADNFPANRGAMNILEKRFNRRCHYRWSRIIDFLKLHYILSKREQPFWREVSKRDILSDRLKEDLDLWRHQPPWKTDFDSVDEAFPEASYQYIIYGMGYDTGLSQHLENSYSKSFMHSARKELIRKIDALSPKVIPNRKLLDLIHGA